MTCEQLWYDHCVQAGRPPEPQPLPAHDLADPTLPLQIALAYVEGEAGYRPAKHLPDVAIWYWRRADNDNRWWLIPAGFERAIFDALGAALGEARKRAGGPVGVWEVAHVLRMRLGRITE